MLDGRRPGRTDDAGVDGRGTGSARRRPLRRRAVGRSRARPGRGARAGARLRSVPHRSARGDGRPPRPPPRRRPRDTRSWVASTPRRRASRFAVGDRVGIAWLRTPAVSAGSAPRGRENLCGRAGVHRLGRRRRLRRVRRGPGGVRLPPPRRVRRRHRGAAAVRRHHRLPSPRASLVPPNGRPRDLRLRRLGAPHGTARDPPRCDGARDDAQRLGSRASPSLGCASAGCAPTPLPNRSTRRSCSRRPVSWFRWRSGRSTGAAPSRSRDPPVGDPAARLRAASCSRSARSAA
jgi:hypothetical protein